MADLGRNGGMIREVGADEHDAAIGLCRMEADGDIGTVKKTDPAHFRRAGKRPLQALRGEHSLPFLELSDSRGGGFGNRPRIRNAGAVPVRTYEFSVDHPALDWRIVNRAGPRDQTRQICPVPGPET